MAKVRQLYPLPGAKQKKRYAEILVPGAGQSRICEPFMGAACRSIDLGIPATLGEINVSQRAIALAPARSKSSQQYIAEYEAMQQEFLAGIDLDVLLPYADRAGAMGALRQEIPQVAEILDARWRELSDRLFKAMAAGEASPGLYSFCQRACFGNVMRLNPRGSAFNVSWHVNKLRCAINFDPAAWCEGLQSQGWRPNVQASWQEAIASVKRPSKTYLLLDPPYIEAGSDMDAPDGESDRKMTPCYPGHCVTGDGRAITYALSIEPIKAALNRGFPLIHFTNYYSPKLDADVTRLAHEAGYLCDRIMLGKCDQMANSGGSGRRKHGDRADTRPAPIEYLWILHPFQQLALFGD